MKTIKFILLSLVLLTLLMVMTGCRCEPSTETWYFYSYKKPVTFIGGVEYVFGHSDASHAYPFVGAECEDTGISFSADGRVVFITYNGERLEGTYTFEHQGYNYTNFTVIFDNGESFVGDAANYFGKKQMKFTFRDIDYTFGTEDERSNTTMDDIIADIYAGNLSYLDEGTITKTEQGYEVKFTELSIVNIDEKSLVYAIQINSDGSYEILDEIREGKAYATSNTSVNYIVLYYIEK